MNEPRICIVGAGNLSTRRIYPNVGAAGAQLVGVCDLDREKARRNARRWGGNVYSEMEKMIDLEKPDGVIICIGPEQHAELAPIVMRKGIPVYTEKPPAATAATALEVAKLAEETGVLCTTAFKKRYNMAYSRARQWLAEIGPEKLMAVSMDYASGYYKNESPRSSFLLDFAVHAIDLVGYLGGDVSEVFAFTREAHAFAVSLQFASGAVGSLSLTDARSFGIPTEEVELSAGGQNWMTIHNSSSWKIGREGKAVEWREPPIFVSGGDGGLESGHLAELSDFVKAIREKRTTRSNICESYKSMVLYEAIKASAETGNVVKVQYGLA